MLPNKLYNRYDPVKDLPSLDGKVIFITGGTSGLGKGSIEALAAHNPAHIYFTGRNVDQAQSLIAEVKKISSTTQLTFIECDFQSLNSVKASMRKFTHTVLDILICCAGIMSRPTGLSKDGYEVQFAVNHIAHALIIKTLLPALQNAATKPNADVRIVILTSTGFAFHPKEGVQFSTLKTIQDFGAGGPWLRYGQSKFANVVYARELARRYPNITTVSVHPGVVATELVANTRFRDWLLIQATQLGRTMKVEDGVLNQLWLAVGAKKENIVNGALYLPVGVESNKLVGELGMSKKHATDLWNWTEEALANF